MDESVDNGGVSAESLPFGYFGPPRFNSWGVHLGFYRTTDDSGHCWNICFWCWYPGNDYSRGKPGYRSCHSACIRLGSPDYTLGSDDGVFIAVGGNELGGVVCRLQRCFEFPAIRLRVSASAGSLTDPTDAYFGIQTTREASSQIFDPSYYDMVRMLPSQTNAFTITSGTVSVPGTEHSFAFSMNDLHSGSEGFNHLSGSQRSGKELYCHRSKHIQDSTRCWI